MALSFEITIHLRLVHIFKQNTIAKVESHHEFFLNHHIAKKPFRQN